MLKVQLHLAYESVGNGGVRETQTSMPTRKSEQISHGVIGSVLRGDCGNKYSTKCVNVWASSGKICPVT